MTHTLRLYIIMMFCSSSTWVSAKNCVPEPAQRMWLPDDAILTWIPSPTDNCKPKGYYIYVETDERTTKYVTTGTRTTFKTLPICQNIKFTLTVVVNGIESDNLTMRTQMPLPPDTNITLDFLRLSAKSEEPTLEWDVEEKLKKCVVRFRLTVRDEADGNSVDRYLRGHTVPLTFTPCTSYIFSVAAVYSAVVEGPPSYLRYRAAAAKLAPPVLQHLTLGDTSVTMTWAFESYSVNRCSPTSLIVDALPHFRQSFVIPNEIDRELYNMNLTGLLPDTIYILNVTVVNEAGPSIPTVATFQTFPSG